MVDDLDDLHVWLLHYFVDPAGWLRPRNLYAQFANLMAGGVDGPLGAALGTSQDVWRGPLNQAAADLDRAGLASIPLSTLMTAQGVFERRTSQKGQRFLAFINEPDSLAADPPGSL